MSINQQIENLVTQCKEYWHGIGTLYLVRGVGKRAIKVVVSPSHQRRRIMNYEEIAYHAANVAVKNGWKFIFVEPDPIDGYYYYGFNAAQVNSILYRMGGLAGKYVCCIMD